MKSRQQTRDSLAEEIRDAKETSKKNNEEYAAQGMALQKRIEENESPQQRKRVSAKRAGVSQTAKNKQKLVLL